MRCKNGNHSCNSCGEKKCGNKHTTCHNADVVEVVRCKDCSHYIDGKCYVTNRSPLFKYNVNIHSRKANDYCSYGERRANNER